MTDATPPCADDKAARDKALRLLSARAYTSGGLAQKLRQDFGEEAAQKAIVRMKALGLIDDEDYARRYASDCVKLKGFSLRRIKYALMEKGVPGDIAETVILEMDEDPARAITEIIHRKYARYLDSEKGLRKTVNALLRLGYGYSDIRAALQNMTEDDDIDFYEE